MNFILSDWISLVLTIIGIGLLIYICLDAHGYFKKTSEAQEETKKKNKDEELKRRKKDP